MRRKKKKSGLLLLLGVGLAAGGIYLYERNRKSSTPAATTAPPSLPAPSGNTGTVTVTPTYVPTVVTPTSGSGTYPVIKGTDANIGDKLWASGGNVTVYKNVNPGTPSDYVIPNGHYGGQVLDNSSAFYLKMQMYSGAPVWDNQSQTIFYLPKSANFTKR